MFGYLVRGLPGHPLHPPLTDATIGSYTFATVAVVLSKLGVAGSATARAWWLALVVALAWSALAIATGFVDWFSISWGSPLWKTATIHMLVMAAASACFLVAAVWGYDSGWHDGVAKVGPFVVTLAGFVALSVGGWIGGSIVFVQGMRVLALADEPAGRAISPLPKPEQEAAEG